mmetsp:Transcript_88717/g.255842  ORF Transcript_88717/g.255842 Transcript_88717/m.255842 type:complete len:330 (+) Transcript_88717:205-1194(+)
MGRHHVEILELPAVGQRADLDPPIPPVRHLHLRAQIVGLDDLADLDQSAEGVDQRAPGKPRRGVGPLLVQADLHLQQVDLRSRRVRAELGVEIHGGLALLEHVARNAKPPLPLVRLLLVEGLRHRRVGHQAVPPHLLVKRATPVELLAPGERPREEVVQDLQLLRFLLQQLHERLQVGIPPARIASESRCQRAVEQVGIPTLRSALHCHPQHHQVAVVGAFSGELQQDLDLCVRPRLVVHEHRGQVRPMHLRGHTCDLGETDAWCVSELVHDLCAQLLVRDRCPPDGPQPLASPVKQHAVARRTDPRTQPECKKMMAALRQPANCSWDA